MIRYEVLRILFLSLCCCHIVSGEEQKEAGKSIPNTLVLQKSQPYSVNRNDASFMSNLATWLFPFGEPAKNPTDSVPAAGSYRNQYLPVPTSNHYPEREECNPCNNEPWIPMAANIGPQSVINFARPIVNSHSSHNTRLDYIPHQPSYKETISEQYGLPIDTKDELSKHLQIQISQVPLKGPSLHEDIIEIADYMLPPPIHYNIPPIYGPPKPIYGPPRPVYGPPKPIYGPPKPIYGPPKPPYRPPKPVYAPSKHVFGPPNPAYGPPKPIYGPPTVDFSPPRPNYAAPTPEYRPPNPEYGPPKPGSTEPQTIYGSPLNLEFGPPQGQYGVPSQYELPPSDQYGAPPSHGNNFGRPATYFQSDIRNYPPAPSLSKPPVVDNNYDHGSTFPSDIIDNSANNYYMPAAVPSDSYGAPVTGDSLSYLEPREQLSLASGDNEHFLTPLPFPNLSSLPVLPIHNSREFNQGFLNPQRSSHSGEHQEDDVKIQKSVKIADYTTAVEHPVNVIQSPIIELNIQERTREDHADSFININGTTNKNVDVQTIVSDIDSQINNNQIHDQKTYNNIFEKLHEGNAASHNIDLSENPIVVEDIHAAASNVNNSFVDLKDNLVKRTNDNQLSITSFTSEQEVKTTEDETKGTNPIKDLLLTQTITNYINDNSIKKFDNVFSAKNESGFTTPTLDYSNWQPTYPETITASNRKVTLFTTKKPKQIIVPYIRNRSPTEINQDWSYKKHTKEMLRKDVYTTLVPVYTPPSSTEIPIWSKFLYDFNLAESKKVAATAFAPPTTTAVYNIRDLLSHSLPFDMHSLQKNIDDWTHQAYSSKSSRDTQKSTEILQTSKTIPDAYFTTQPYIPYNEPTTTRNIIDDNLVSASSQNSTVVDKDIESNLIEGDTTETITSSLTTIPPASPLSSKDQISLWDVSYTTISPITKEKVYVVTPQTYTRYTSTPASAWSMAPKIENGTANNGSTYDTHKFSIRVESESKPRGEKHRKNLEKAVKVIYSEWPHLINNLETTTPGSTSLHPLFGLMHISTYTPPPNSTVRTIDGHSKVTSVVTLATPLSTTTQTAGGPAPTTVTEKLS